jgi:hypothetical protein
MDQAELPPELADLERELLGRPRPETGVAFRRRVLAAVRSELSRRKVCWSEHIPWGFMAGTAAAALLWVNFSMSVANDTAWRFSAPPELGGLDAAAGRIHDLAPELPEREAYRQALLLRLSLSSTPLPAVSASPDPRLLLIQEFQAWRMR